MINFIGLGKLGFSAALFFASKRFVVSGYDKNEDLILGLQNHDFEINEEKNEKYLKYFNKIKFYSNVQLSLNNSKVSIITVPTPSNKDKSFSNEYILESLKQIAIFIKKNKKNNKIDPYLITIASTVSPGSFKNVFEPYMKNQFGLKINKDFYFCYNPYFVALGNSFDTFENPDFLLLGYSSLLAKKKILNIYSKVYKKKELLQFMSLNEAELVKLLVNSFVTTKISYTNFISNLCKTTDIANPKNILKAMGMDKRIGVKAFKMGGPFDGPCFPRDNLALINYCKSKNIDYSIPSATIKINASKINELKWSAKILKKNSIKKVGFLGIGYKKNTNCLEGGNTINLIKYFIRQKLKVYYYDKYIKVSRLEGAIRCNSMQELTNKANLVYVSYVDSSFTKITKSQRKLKIWDIWGLLKSNNKHSISSNLLDLI
jgi:UDPglucose 6-dehydrogenase